MDPKDRRKSEIIADVNAMVPKDKKPKKKNRGGRPKGAVKKPTLRQVEEFIGLGFTEKQMADALGISVEAIAKWKQSDIRFLQTLRNARKKYDSGVIRCLRERALGYSCKETKVFCHEGDITEHEITRYYPPDPTSMIFWLKNRDKENWRDKYDVEHGETDELLEKHKEMSNEELERRTRKIAEEILGIRGTPGAKGAAKETQST